MKIPLVNPLLKSVSCVPPPIGTGINEKSRFVEYSQHPFFGGTPQMDHPRSCESWFCESWFSEKNWFCQIREWTQRSAVNTREILSVLYRNFGFKNSGWTLEFGLRVGVGRSGWMIGSLCLNIVPNTVSPPKIPLQQSLRKSLNRLFIDPGAYT